jgi:quinol monooxygenase YgiN
MTVQIVAQGTVAAADAAKFRKIIAEATAIVREKERGRTLAYDFFTSDSGDLNCLIHERYTDADALVMHLQNLGEKLTAITEFFKVDRMLISGPLPAQLLGQFKAFGNVQYYGETASIL